MATPKGKPDSGERASFEELIKFRCPSAVAERVEAAAGHSLLSKSAYVRAALLDRLRADGFAPAVAA